MMLISDLLYYCGEHYIDFSLIEIHVTKKVFEDILPQARKLGYKLRQPGKYTPNKIIKISENVIIIDSYISNEQIDKAMYYFMPKSNDRVLSKICEILNESERAIKDILE